MSLTETRVPVSTSVEEKKLQRDGNPRKLSFDSVEWKDYEKVLFRFAFTYFLLQIIPLDWKYYRDLFSLDWTSAHFSNIFYLARYSPRIFSDVPVFYDWILIGLVAVIVTVTWGSLDSDRKEYNTLFYWLRVVLRYRLALALLAYGFIKLFPMQMPEPSLSNLNTNYGDISHWKIFSMSTGIVSGYQSFLGFVEILAALLLLNRKTATVGAFIIIPFTGNVVMSNLAYEGGEYIYSLLLVTFAIAIFVYDLPRLFSLTSSEIRTLPARFKPAFKNSRLKYGRVVAKSLFVLFFVFVYGYQTYSFYKEDIYHFPSAKTPLADISGIYNVSTFRLNGKNYPFAFNDPVRWRDVVFEKWTTLSIRSGAEVEVVKANTEEIFLNDEDRIYELSGTAGRHYYSYEADTVQRRLVLTNRNKNHRFDFFEFSYERPTKDRVVLSGLNPKGDSLYVVLDRLHKKYLLEEAAKYGRRRGLKL